MSTAQQQYACRNSVCSAACVIEARVTAAHVTLQRSSKQIAIIRVSIKRINDCSCARYGRDTRLTAASTQISDTECGVCYRDQLSRSFLDRIHTRLRSCLLIFALRTIRLSVADILSN